MKRLTLVGLGEVTDRRQLRAGSQMPVLDLSLDASDDLVDEAQIAVLADGEGEHSDSRSLNWPGPWTSTVPYTDSKTVHCRTDECS